jgi:hypothetical protein
MPLSRSRVIATALGLALVACEGPTAPVRTPYDFSSQLGGGTFHWPAERLPVRYWVNPADSIDAYVERALPLWANQFLYAEFRGVLVADSSKADVIFVIFPAFAPHGPLTNFPAQDNVNACQGYTTFSAVPSDPIVVSLLWKDFADSAGVRLPVATDEIVRCLARVVTHEIGHTLGIGAHSANPLDLMFTSPRVFEPSANDRMTAEVVYHTPATLALPDRPR